MNDLFANMQEKIEECVSMKVDSGIPEKAAIEQAASELHPYEVRDMIRRFYPHLVETMIAYFATVETRRGKAAADKLRDGTREAWKAAKAAA